MRRPAFEGALQFAWRSSWRQIPLFWAGLAGVVAVWIFVEALVIGGDHLGRLWWWFWHIAFFVLISFPEIMLTQMALDRRDGVSASLRGSTRNFRLVGVWFVTKMLYLVVVAVGVVFLIVPGIHLGVRFQFVPFCLLDGNRTPVAAFRASSRLTGGNRTRLFLLDLVLLLVNALGAALMGAGLLLTIPWSLLALAHVFRMRRDPV